MNYNFFHIQQKWQKFWQDNDIFKFDINKKQSQIYYILEMFPFPSGSLHMGHLRNYTIGDVIARFKKMQNFNILHPMGFDAFGLPAENAAIERNISPDKWVYDNIDNMKKELKEIGLSYDWSLSFATCDKDYYKYGQEIFYHFYKNNLIYQKESYVNWDPVDKTVLANEQVIDGLGWRSGAKIEKKKLKQWFLRISDFSSELLSELDNLPNWDKRVISMQKKWIGKTIGAEIIFKTDNNENIKIYSTRPETIFGASFIGISANHEFLKKINITDDLKNIIDQINNNIEKDKDNNKIGVFTGHYAYHPFIRDLKIPIYIANFILTDYGSGAIFGCPAEDERDREFALKYNLPIKKIIQDNHLINSNFLDNLTIEEAKIKIISMIEESKIGSKKINYKLRDWCISRQRYWGCPIPILYDENNNIHLIELDDLPVILPKNDNLTIDNNPLHNKDFKYINYKGQKMRRETDTLDTFFESSWYFLRFASKKENKIFDIEEINKILPVDTYIGGIEHAVLHLLYARFFTKALKKCGLININEPFDKLITQGMVCHKTYKDINNNWLLPEETIEKEGKIYDKNNDLVEIGRYEKMSKSKKNIISPVKIINKYGSDTARLFMLSDSPIDKDLIWSDKIIKSCYKYLNKIHNFIIDFINKNESLLNSKILSDEYLLKFSEKFTLNDICKNFLYNINKYIYLIQKEYNDNNLNVVIARSREFFNLIEEFIRNNNNPSKEFTELSLISMKNFIIFIYPITPHLAEELYLKLHKDNLEKDNILSNLNHYPQYDIEYSNKYLVSSKKEISICINGKSRDVIKLDDNYNKSEIEDTILARDKITKYITNKKDIKKIIHIKNKIINIVI